MRHAALILSLAAVQAAVAATDSITIVSRLMEAADPMLRVPSLAYDNPVLMGMAADVSLSAVGASATDTHRNGDPQRGTGSDRWQLGAATYTHTTGMTLWGDASYSAGRTRDVVWNETADIDLIYPYITADSVGGDINSEYYSLGGGCSLTGSSWGWGVSAHYTAAQHYRAIDPRPRNITGLLDLGIGVSHKAWGGYTAAASLDVRRYTQSSDIDFKSETGVEKIYHLTGLGNHYARFAGLGQSAHYGGYRYGASVNLYPDTRRGLSLSVTASRFTFTKVLDDLNKLPLADAWHNELQAQVALLAPSEHTDWAVSCLFKAYRRHGAENIFGDASSNIYPQIGSLEMYADNSRDVSLTALVVRHTRQYRLWARAAGGYCHRREVYAMPYATQLSAQAYGRGTVGYTQTGGKLIWHVVASLIGTGHIGIGYEAGAGADFALSRSQALGINARYIGIPGYRSLGVSLALSF